MTDRTSSSEGSRTSRNDATIAPGGPPRGTPARLGRSTVLRVIASGGMGTVLMVLQDGPRRSFAVHPS